MYIWKGVRVGMGWNADTVHALGLYRMVGRVIGIWPVDFPYILSKIKVAFVTIILMWMCTDFATQLLIKGSCGTVTEIVDLISISTCGCLSMIKLVVLRIHRRNVLKIVNSAIEDWSRSNEQLSRSIMLQYANTGRRVFITQAVGYCCSSVFLISSRLPSITPVWSNQSNFSLTANGLPLWSGCWIPEDITITQYALRFIHQSFTLAVLDTCYSSCDSFFFGMAMHLCGQFKVLSTHFKTQHGSDNSESTRNHLVQFIKRHQHLLMLSDMLEEAYNFIILIHVGVATTTICISGIVLLVSLESSDVTVVSDMFLRIVLIYLQIFMYCYAGEQLGSVTVNLKTTIYDSSWYDMPLNSMRSLTFVMMRCQYPSKLTAAGMFCMNFFNFVGIVKTITSYFSVLRLMFKEDR